MLRLIRLIIMMVLIFLSSLKAPTIVYFDDDESMDYKHYIQNIDDLIDESDLIILAQNQLSLEERIENEDLHDHKNLGTRTRVEVNHVFKPTQGIAEGDTLLVLEPFKIIKSSDKVKLHCYSGYRNMVFKGHYLLFLKEHVMGDGEIIYSIMGLYQGKYPLSLIKNQDDNNIDMSLLEISKGKEASYRLLINEIRKEFQEREWILETQ